MEDETLKRLLAAETEAEAIVLRANQQREAILEQARQDADAARRQHEERIAQIRSSYLAQAEERAQATISTMKRKHQALADALRDSAKRNEQPALDEALVFLAGMVKG
jgi:vacuolar-type H+-ATPase subunit H